MTKEEYFEEKRKRIYSMSLDVLRESYLSMDKVAQGYFTAMNKNDEDLKIAKILLAAEESKTSSLREQLKEKEEEIKELKQTLTEANVLTGKQAERFEEMILNPKPITNEELKNLERANEMMQRIVKKSPGTVEYKNDQLEALIESQSKLIESLAEALRDFVEDDNYGRDLINSVSREMDMFEAPKRKILIKGEEALTEYNNYKNKQNGK